MGQMKRAKHAKGKGVLDGMVFIPLPTEVLGSRNFASLSPAALKLFMALLAELRPKRGNPASNNGNLSVALKLVSHYGFGSQHTITKAKDELLHKGWLEITKIGGLGMGPTLYAFTIWPIADLAKSHGIQPTAKASKLWLLYNDENKSPAQKVHHEIPQGRLDDAVSAYGVH